MKNKVKILNVEIDNISQEELLARLEIGVFEGGIYEQWETLLRVKNK